MYNVKNVYFSWLENTVLAAHINLLSSQFRSAALFVWKEASGLIVKRDPALSYRLEYSLCWTLSQVKKRHK